ncbi:MAG TPA: peptidylprolyl isomerase [Pirellulaceae bacterium]|nr:peptidylprolyl isomerase [Pirellulaceae bacterium]
MLFCLIGKSDGFLNRGSTGWVLPCGQYWLARFGWVALVVCSVWTCSTASWGQSARDDLQREIAELRRIARVLSESGAKYFHGTREESAQHRSDFEAATIDGERQMGNVEQAMRRVLQEGLELTEDERLLAIEIRGWLLRQGFYHRAYEFGRRGDGAGATDTNALVATQQAIAAANPTEFHMALLRTVEAQQAVAAVTTNRFEEALSYAQLHGDAIRELPEAAEILFNRLGELRTKFEKERQLREAEAAADDLPRVVLRTTKGRIELELYENEAPDTVGNFIYLVESGFYTNIIFHRVIADNMAQGGAYTHTGEDRTPPYSIFDECRTPDARNHFFGTISMATTNFPNSGNSQFFITFVPCPHLDGKHTVFGRVISGFDALETLNRTISVDSKTGATTPMEGVVPDRILSAEVVRKRDREYTPRKVIGN